MSRRARDPSSALPRPPMLPIGDRNPTRTTPFVNYVAHRVNVAAFVWQYVADARRRRSVARARLRPRRHAPRERPAGEAFTVLTSMFMHGGWVHLGGNMLFLYIFGDNVEDAMGHVRYVAFYLLAGIGAAVGADRRRPGEPRPDGRRVGRDRRRARRVHGALPERADHGSRSVPRSASSSDSSSSFRPGSSRAGGSLAAHERRRLARVGSRRAASPSSRTSAASSRDCLLIRPFHAGRERVGSATAGAAGDRPRAPGQRPLERHTR